MKILIADDSKIERLILSRILENFEHEVVQAEDGNQAIQLFEEHHPQLVFLDVLMPGCDGYEVAQTIKKDEINSWVPIIFLTSLTGAEDLAKCIDVGGDDFVSKPINKVIIKAKLEAFGRILNLYATVHQQQEKIEVYNQHLLQEQEAAKVIFDNIVHKGCLEESNINYHLSPMSIFNGDLMLSTHLNDGSMRFMLADFTGHGLPAAIGSLPASEIFYGMSNKGFSIVDMMKEMNKKLYEVLPTGIFCCVIIFDIDPLGQRMTIWNAGAPDCFLLDTKNNNITSIASTHLAIGILSPKSFRIKCESFHFSEHHKIIAATDGIMEAEDPNQAMFGEPRIIEFIQSNWFAELENKQFDMIVSNPPYIKENDPHLNQGDVRFEPLYALISGADGLDDIRRIIKNSLEYLNKGGALLIEHGYDQADEVCDLLKASNFAKVSDFKDDNDNPRVAIGHIQ
ncbi:MAG: SpoIIE family protein phosphatase [Kangiellaceae bacterium]|nr:SpoIIE family protein phosphatase [Kangiellaceae bacterium]